MSLNPNTYVKCPYCAMSYKDDTEEHRDAIAGHINLKHPDQPKVKRAKDFRVEIPSDDFNAPHHSKELLQKPEKSVTEDDYIAIGTDGTYAVTETGNTITVSTVPTEEPEYRVRETPLPKKEHLTPVPEVEAMKPKEPLPNFIPTAEEFNQKNKEQALTKKQKLRQKLEQQLKELNDSE